jgi:hypothetical protein
LAFEKAGEGLLLEKLLPVLANPAPASRKPLSSFSRGKTNERKVEGNFDLSGFI